MIEKSCIYLMLTPSGEGGESAGCAAFSTPENIVVCNPDCEGDDGKELEAKIKALEASLTQPSPARGEGIKGDKR